MILLIGDVINQNKKLLWKNLLGVLFLFVCVKIDQGLYPYIVLFFIFNIFEGVLSKTTQPQNYYILIGQGLTFVFSALIFLGWSIYKKLPSYGIQLNGEHMGKRIL